MEEQGIVCTTLDSVPGRQVVTTLGVVSGWAAITGLNCNLALQRMLDSAGPLRPDAIVGIRMSPVDVQGGHGVAVYGTAVKLK